MKPKDILPEFPLVGSEQIPERPEDYLSPEQRLDAIAEILATIALRSLRKHHEAQPPDTN
jgi:hypothetical protein